MNKTKYLYLNKKQFIQLSKLSDQLGWLVFDLHIQLSRKMKKQKSKK
jgi:hypothetical protein